MTNETKEKVREQFQDWVASKERKAIISAEMKENIEAVAQLLDIDKKKSAKLFKLMESDPTSEYNVFQLYEEVSKV